MKEGQKKKEGTQVKGERSQDWCGLTARENHEFRLTHVWAMRNKTQEQAEQNEAVEEIRDSKTKKDEMLIKATDYEKE